MRRIISKIAKIKCACGYTGDATFSEDRGWNENCPKCGKTHSVDGTRGKRLQDFGGNRRFSGDEQFSVTEGFHPKEVDFARRNMPKSGHCIQDSGMVRFRDRATQKAFVRELGTLKARLGIDD